MYFYHVFNLSISSEIEIPQFTAISKPHHVDVHIGPDSTIPLPKHTSPLGTEYEYLSPMDVLVGWPTLGWFRIQGGRSIGINPVAGVALATCTLPLFGLVFALLLQQRKEYVLHGSGVVIDGGGAIFVGEKGHGKSTLASWFMADGAPIITDDVAAIFTEDGNHLLRSGFPLMKLWPNSIEVIGKEPELFERILPEMEKRSVEVDMFCDTPVPVAGIFILSLGGQLAIRRLSLQEGLLGLARNMMGCGFTRSRPESLTREIFENGAALLHKVPVYALSRPQDLGLLAKTGALVRDAIQLQCESNK